MIFQVTKIISYPKKKALKMYQFCLELKKKICLQGGSHPDAAASDRRFAPVPRSYQKFDHGCFNKLAAY